MNNLTYLKAFVDNERLKNPSIKIVATNGCFDVLHYGHLQMLKTAKSFGLYTQTMQLSFYRD